MKDLIGLGSSLHSGDYIAASPLRRISALFYLLLILSLVPLAGCRNNSEPSLKRAAEAWDAKEYSVAAEEYEKYLERFPTGAESLLARFQLANIYNFNLKQYDQAIAHYRELLRQDPAGANANLARERVAELLGELGRTYEAIAEYENLNPQDATERRRIRLRIADLYYDQNNYSQALTEYEKVITGAAYDDLTEQALMREAAVYNARGQYQSSLAVYQKLAAESNDEEARRRAMYGIADCYAGLYQFDEAIKTLREIKDASERENIARRVAELERRKREAAEARTGLQ
ncbi:MAG TPA: tetratricopeptide repeat protein [Blastocatellia bacterium]|nr:tetratricopeptide repeat protein [Blastocatellia bacterium]